MKAISLLCIFCFLIQSSHAASFELFDSKGEQTLNYREILDGLRFGDILIFKKGRYRFKFIEAIDAGEVTQVLKVESLNEGPYYNKMMALRVAKDIGNTHYGLVDYQIPYVHYIESYRKGIRKLENHNIRIPQTYYAYENQFVAVEFIHSDFNLFEFLLNENTIDEMIIDEAEELLMKFFQTAAKFKIIGDFHPFQLSYNIKNKEWVLLDFTQGHARYTFISNAEDRKKNNPMVETLEYMVRKGLLLTGSYRRIRAENITERVSKIYAESFNESRFKTLRCFAKFLGL